MKQKQLITALLPTQLLIICLIFSFASCQKSATTSATKNSASSVNNSAAVASSSLVAWYKFTSGSLADYSGNNNNIVFSNATPTTDYMGKPNNAYLFNGSGSYMVVNNSASLNPSNITIGVLIKPLGFYQGIGGNSRILMKGIDDQSSGIYLLGFNNDGAYYGTYGDNQFFSAGATSSSNVVKLNKWQKVVYTYNGTTAKLYINDMLASQVNATASFNANIDPLNIGKTGRADYPYWFNGVIDEIRIYNVAVSQLQAQQIGVELGK